jgi:peptidyl-prolyl cis-trans isomerase SurA
MKKSILLFMLIAHVVLFSQKKSKTLVTINDSKITVADFKKVYEKNLAAIDNEESKNVPYNLDLFINYTLKVKEAYQLKLDTLPSYIKEIETYRNQLSAPYLQDKSFTENLIKEAYFRTKNEIKAKHILIRTKKNATPADTLAAYNKILKIRNRILAGEDFEKVAAATSDDDSARDNPQRKFKGNKGNLGYFSAFKMVYPFEEAAYKTPVGEVSMPFKTRFGYHILKVDNIRVYKGEVEVAHILVTDLAPTGKTKIDEVYTKLIEGKSFDSLAKRYSNDNSSKDKGGKLTKFGTGRMVPSFEKAAFSLRDIGDFSKPFKTRFGWHILRLLKKHPLKSFEEMKATITERLKRSGRMKLSDDAVLNKLKKNYRITEHESAKLILNRKDIRTISKDSLQNILFSINERNFTQAAFVSSIANKKRQPIAALFELYKNEEIVKYFKENLVNTAPEYATILKEYEDGLLLFELMQQKIWHKSSKDTLGLKQFFVENKKNYAVEDLSEIKGQVINDYQNFLEQNWIADLRKKNSIKINKRQLKKLIKFYEKK